MATIAQELAASQDADLLKRAIQAAQRQRIPNAQYLCRGKHWATRLPARRGRLHPDHRRRTRIRRH